MQSTEALSTSYYCHYKGRCILPNLLAKRLQREESTGPAPIGSGRIEPRPVPCMTGVLLCYFGYLGKIFDRKFAPLGLKFVFSHN